MRNDTAHQPFWTFTRWFSVVVILGLAAGVTYGLLHAHFNHNHKWNHKLGYEYIKLNTAQLQQINSIYSRSTEDSLQGNRNSALRDTNTTADTDTAIYLNIVDYLQSEFNGKVDSAQLLNIRSYLIGAQQSEATGFLTNLRLRVKTYFWLTGPEVYFEIMFWSFFGVICSIVFRMGNQWRRVTSNPENPESDFDPTDVPSHIAKMLYAPICTLIVVFGFNFVQDSNIPDISSSKGVIVFAFIAGFYSQRVMAFLDRLKDVLLPNSGSADLPVVSTKAKLAIKFVAGTTVPDNIKAIIASKGFEHTKVSVTYVSDGSNIAVTPVDTVQDADLTVVIIKKGDYHIKAECTVKTEEGDVNMEGETTIDIHNDIAVNLELNVKAV